MFALLTEWISDPDWPVVAGCVAALMLAAGAYTAVGIAFSAGTDSQVVSAVLTYATLFSMLIVSALSQAMGSPELQALVAPPGVHRPHAGLLRGQRGAARRGVLRGRW
ncbi:MAG: hypothetical protein HC898_06740, partial [Phycisphaerales bacterium]|nr:hypothetical protein [Phycisphaerales bacterium]